MAARRIVLVDDDPSMQSLLRLVLELDGEFSVVGQASDGAAVIDLVAAEAPDVVVVDMHLPRASGEQVVDALRHRTGGRGARPAIVGYSAESERLAAAAAAGADATVCKDEPLEALLDALRRVGRPPAQSASPPGG
jgi:DNA-binding NarL/FixJ family response regulator